MITLLFPTLTLDLQLHLLHRLILDSSTAGVGKSFIDNVYVVQSVQNVERNIIGIGTSVFRRVFVNVDDTFAFGTAGTISTTTLAGYGEYSWGKMVMASRAASNSTLLIHPVELLELTQE